MPLDKSSSKAAFSKNVSEMMHAGHPQNQAVAAAYATQREAKGRAFGGVAPMLGQASASMAPGGMQPPPGGAMPPPGAMPPLPGGMQPPMQGVAGGVAPPPMMGPQMGMPPGSPGLAGSRGFAFGGVAGPVTKTFKGPIVSSVPGRTDNHFTHVPSGSFVIPADIVSGHGEGNTLAGMNHLQKLFKMGPHATPKMPGAPSALHKLSRGGQADEHVGKPVPVKLAGGEIVVPPENVHETMERVNKKKLSLSQAHAAMDAWVVNKRKKLRKTLASLPGPAKD